MISIASKTSVDNCFYFNRLLLQHVEYTNNLDSILTDYFITKKIEIINDSNKDKYNQNIHLIENRTITVISLLRVKMT